jgi:uncharacterized membrane protein
MSDLSFTKGNVRPVECLKEGWASIKQDYWLMFAIGLVGALIAGVTLYILLGAMLCGIYFAFLNKVDGKPATLDDLWVGFKHFGPGLIVTAAIVIPMIVVYALIYVPVLIAIAANPTMSEDELMAVIFGALAVDLVVIVIMVCFHSLIIFAFPLIVDRGLGGIESMIVSAKAVWKNLAGVTGLIGLQMGLMIVGMIPCGLGIYFLVPVMMAANAAAYRRMFPAMEASGHALPPPPSAYGNF